MDFSSLNYLAIAAAAIAAFGLGALWYSPISFGKVWQKELGFTDEYLAQANMALVFGTSFLLILGMSLGLALFIRQGDDPVGWLQGIYHGLFIGIAFVGTSLGINLIYQRKSLKLWLIDAGYQIMFLAMMGSILGAWQ